MDDFKIRKIIHEARGLCVDENFDMNYTTNWADYGEVLEWAKKQEWWNEFADGFLYKFSREFYDDKYTDVDIISNPETGSRALAEFLQTEKEVIK